MVIYLGAVHMMALWAVLVILAFGGLDPLFGQGAMRWQTFALAAVTYICSGFGITAGAHRLWAHRSYKAGLPLRVLLMVFNSIANQGTIVHWARDHRTHHLYSDTIADP